MTIRLGSILLLFLLVSVADGLRCNFLRPEDRKKANLEYDAIEQLVQSIECPQQTGKKPHYACYTRVANGELHMGCYNKDRMEHRKGVGLRLKQHCREVLWHGRPVCDYEETEDTFGMFYATPGNGLCCCMTELCNQAPPRWLLAQSPEDLRRPGWRKNLVNLAFSLTVITVFVLLFAFATVLQHFLSLWIKKWLGKRAKPPGIPEDEHYSTKIRSYDEITADDIDDDFKDKEAKPNQKSIMKMKGVALNEKTVGMTRTTQTSVTPKDLSKTQDLLLNVEKTQTEGPPRSRPAGQETTPGPATPEIEMEATQPSSMFAAS